MFIARRKLETLNGAKRDNSQCSVVAGEKIGMRNEHLLTSSSADVHLDGVRDEVTSSDDGINSVHCSGSLRAAV